MELHDKIEKFFRIDANQKKALARLGLFTLSDLLYFFPSRYTNISEIRQINTLADGETVTVLGTLSKLETKKSFKSKIPMGAAELTDLSGSIHIVWFHQPYLAKMLTDGAVVRVTGKVSESKSYGLTLTNPEITKEDILPIDLHDSLFHKDKNGGENIEQFGFPVYAESQGITSKWIYHAIVKILKQDCAKEIKEYIPEEILKKYNLPSLYNALVWIHMPQKEEHAEKARKRFAFEEIFFIQLARAKERKEYEENFSYKLKVPEADVKDFISRFPFTPTEAQSDAITTILKDVESDRPMSRLVEGDVGSGKTFVAATIAYAVIKNRPFDLDKNKLQTFGSLQVAYMAPTEVLATQLFENFIQYFKHTGISIGLVTGSGCRKFPTKVASAKDEWTTISRAQLLKWVKNGEIPIVIGTHALISKSVDFKHLALVIIDEQHRFGTNQRMKLAKKESNGRKTAPHYLSMTATPIPRTLALTIYGDLDLTIIDQMPAGRKEVITKIIPENKRTEAYEAIRTELKAGRQAYIICPRIDEPDPDKEKALQMKNVTSEAKRLQKDVFPEYRIGIMHSKMTKQKKEDVMDDFAQHKIDILVSTSVIEVGVNVPNATSIIVEGAERFGLAQLHQLRGRVIRSTHQSYCYLFTSDSAKASTAKDAKSTTRQRLDAMTKAANGFELAELDLSLRGAGALSGNKQWGITDLGMEAIKNIKLVEFARTEAHSLIASDPELKLYPLLSQTLASKNLTLHFE